MHQLYSLDTMNSALPEFFEVAPPERLVNKAFHDSFVEKITDMKHWKSFRTKFLDLAQNERNPPRELARLKFALTHKGDDLMEPANYGRRTLQDYLDQEVQSYIRYMTTQELLSVMFGFSRNRKPDIYLEAFERLKVEIMKEPNLDVLSVAPYIVARSAPGKLMASPWYPNTDLNLDLLATVTPLLINRMTEFSSGQLATICSGLNTMNLHPKRRTGAEELVSAIEAEILYRRVETLSGENLAEVLKSFANVNLGTDQLFAAFSDKLPSTLEEIDIDAAVDLAHSLVSREMLPSEVLARFNKRLTKDMASVRRSYVGKLAEYLFFIQTNDRPLLSNFVKFVEAAPVPLAYYTQVRHLKLWMEPKHSALLTPLFLQNADKYSNKFWIEKCTEGNPEFKTKEFETFFRILSRNLQYRSVKAFGYENLWYTDYAFMPQKVGINLAQPDFHLIGNVVFDTRFVKEPALRYRPKHSFKMKGEALKLFGWKVVEFNYHDLMENCASREERERLIKEALTKVGIEPTLKS